MAPSSNHHRIASPGIAKISSLILASSVLMVSNVLAQGVPWSPNDAEHEASAEASECFSYYTIIQQCLVNSDQGALAIQVGNSADRAKNLIVLFGHASGSSEEAMQAFLKIAQEDQLQAIDKTCMNSAVLVQRYSSFCKALLEHPDTRLMKLLAGPPPNDTP